MNDRSKQRVITPVDLIDIADIPHSLSRRNMGANWILAVQSE